MTASTEEIRRGARVSGDGLYRYELTRTWDPANDARAVWIMLNPSTADAMVDDATVRRCIGFSKREGFGTMTVLNLYAYRSKDPDQLGAVADPVGPDNRETIAEWTDPHIAVKVIAAWGSFVPFGREVLRGQSVPGNPRGRAGSGGRPSLARLSHAQLVQTILNTIRSPRVYCLGTTKDGHPRHPLYVAADQPLQVWRELR